MENITQIVPVSVPDITLAVKREDLIHPFVSGNKFRKLKYNLLRAKREHHKTILTFGGAFSNHIAAVAAAGKAQNLQTIGVIRGEELAEKIDANPTLSFARDNGMQLEFVSRETYRLKDQNAFIENLRDKFGDFYLIPEGGTNELAVRGCEEILSESDSEYNFVCCAVGTGGTISGLINSAKPHQKVLGFPALKGDFLKQEICKFARNGNWDLITGYEFGGYGKVDTDLVAFLNQFFSDTGILLDPLYTGKMLFGVMDLVKQGYFPNGSKILAIHTGGIQGIEGMNRKLRHKNLPLIDTHD